MEIDTTKYGIAPEDAEHALTALLEILEAERVSGGGTAGDAAERLAKRVHEAYDPRNPSSEQATELLIVVDSAWVDFVTKYNDIFGYYGIGQWAMGAYNDESGWLIYEHGGEERRGDLVERETPPEVLAAWDAGQPLPEKWHRLDRALAVKAFVEGVKARGVNWYTSGEADAPFYGYVIQMALFGEERYA